MNALMPFDELNTFKTVQLPSHFENGKIRSEEDLEDIIDELLDLFLLSYAQGVTLTNSDLASEIAPELDDVMRVVDREVAGKTWRERVRDYYENGGTEADIVRIAETEAHRDSNEAAYETARKAGATTKTWRTVGDDRVRDTHFWLDGVTAPIDGEFYNYKGESTQFPGQWGIAEEDVNCRCWVTYGKE